MTHNQLVNDTRYANAVLTLSTGLQRVMSRIGGGISKDVDPHQHLIFAPYGEDDPSAMRGSLYNLNPMLR